MNAIDKALQEIRADIPLPILKRAFLNKMEEWTILPVSLDSVIRDQVIGQRVWTDCSLVGAQQMLIPLNELRPTQPDPYSYVYRIPKHLTNGRSIISVLDVVYYIAQGWAAYGGQNSSISNQTNQCENSPILRAAKALKDVDGPIPMISTANAQVIGENVILINDNSGLVVTGGAHVMLAHDENFSNIKPTMYRLFARLCLLATKAWIYTTLLIDIDQDELWAGIAVGRFKQVVEGYADANEMYNEMLDTRWKKANIINDTVSSQRLVRGLFGFAR